MANRKTKLLRAGEKVVATDAAQTMVETAVDSLEGVAIDKAVDAAELVKTKAKKAGVCPVPLRARIQQRPS